MGGIASSVSNPTAPKPCTKEDQAAMQAPTPQLCSPSRSPSAEALSADMTNDDIALQQACPGASCPKATHLAVSSEKTHSVRLLDLPLDVLKEVVKEVSQANTSPPL